MNESTKSKRFENLLLFFPYRFLHMRYYKRKMSVLQRLSSNKGFGLNKSDLIKGVVPCSKNRYSSPRTEQFNYNNNLFRRSVAHN